MPKFYTSVSLLINQSEEIGDEHFSVFGSRGLKISPLMHVPLSERSQIIGQFRVHPFKGM